MHWGGSLGRFYRKAVECGSQLAPRGGSVPTSDTPGIPSAFIVLFVIVAIIAVGGAIWRAVVLSRGGLNPFVAKEQLEAQLAQNLRNAGPPTSAQPVKATEERLTELDDLYKRGVITADERVAGRAKIIGGG
jgi:hypothetical protein